MELFAADGHDAGGCERVTGKSGMRPIDFVDVQALWADPDLLEIPGRVSDESRYIVIGRLGDKHWSCVITYREGRTRIISARRARPREIRLHEGK